MVILVSSCYSCYDLLCIVVYYYWIVNIYLTIHTNNIQLSYKYLRGGNYKMKCIKCDSENVNIQAVTTTKSSSHHSLLYWIIVGWWLEAILWICLFLPKLIYELFKPNRIKSKTHSEAICQQCGYRWKV